MRKYCFFALWFFTHIYIYIYQSLNCIAELIFLFMCVTRWTEGGRTYTPRLFVCWFDYVVIGFSLVLLVGLGLYHVPFILQGESKLILPLLYHIATMMPPSPPSSAESAVAQPHTVAEDQDSTYWVFLLTLLISQNNTSLKIRQTYTFSAVLFY
jgi:hypothetical protein